MMLIEELGLEGYGAYWVLIETLRDQPDHKAPLAILPALARRYNTTAEKMKAVVVRYDLFQVDEANGTFESESLLRRMEMVNAKSKKARENALKRWDGNTNKKPPQSTGNAPAMQTQSDRNAIKEKKGNEKKGKQTLAGTETEAVKIWMETLRQHGIQVYYRDLINNADIKDLDLWRACCTEWFEANYRVTNVVDLLKLYRKRIDDVVMITNGKTEQEHRKETKRYTYDEMLAVMSKEGLTQANFQTEGKQANGKPWWRRVY